MATHIAQPPYALGARYKQPGTVTEIVQPPGSSDVEDAAALAALAATRTKDLTESTATVFAEIPLPVGGAIAGYIDYAIHASDGTDFQVRSGVLDFRAVNKAGTETATLEVGEAVAVSAGTLTNTFTSAGTANDSFQIFANAVSSLTQTSLFIEFRVVVTSGAAVVTYP